MNSKKKTTIHLLLLYIILLSFTNCTKKPDLLIDNSISGIEELPILDETISTAIPHIYIDIENNQEVTVKKDYLHADLSITGTDDFPTLSTTSTRIRGRGNSTWTYPKKPYRLKLDNAASILGLSPAKDWVLLANYNDYTLMTNAIAMKMGKQLQMPFTHDIIPVDLTINGQYRGSYNLTQQVEVHENRVNVGKGGVLWELDSYFDEEWQFRSASSNLPVMLKDPKVESEEEFELWKNEFNLFDYAINSNTASNPDLDRLLDKQQLVNFLIVNLLTANHEINHPKSVFVHKREGGKYTFGPLWDFDYAFGFDEQKRTYFNNVKYPILPNNDKGIGSIFFRKLFNDNEIKQIFKKTWESYKINEFENLMEFIDKYASTVRESQKNDYELWKVGNNNHAQNKANIKSYLRKRTVIIDTFVSAF